ncbi:MAG TPA: caspase family protein [Capsulimonadaceae bacterium]|jgi:hypothetical protein
MKTFSLAIRAFAVGLLVLSATLGTRADQPDLTKRIYQTPIAEAPTYAKRALVIGINNYENVPKLAACSNDAQNFAKFLKTKLGFASVTIMTDEPGTAEPLKPTGAHIKRQVNLLLDNIVQGQTQLVLFYSGHGVRTQSAQDGDADWLVPQDADPKDIAGTCVNYTQFKSRLDTKQPARALLVMDACRNILEGKAAVGSSGFGGKFEAMGPQIAELLSCQPTQTSLEGDPRDFSESVFTHYLLRGLSGDPDAAAPGTNLVTFDSLKLYVQGQVSQYAETRIHASQLPDGRSTLGSMVLAKHNPNSPLPPDFQPTTPPTNPLVKPTTPTPVKQPEPAPYTPPAPTRATVTRGTYSYTALNGWSLDTGGAMGTDIILRAPIERNFTANISVIVRHGAAGYKPSSLTGQYNQMMSMAVPNWRLTSTKDVTVGGKPGIRFIGEYWMPQMQVNAHVEETFVFNGDLSYDMTFTGLATNYKTYQPSYEAFLSSFQFGGSEN